MGSIETALADLRAGKPVLVIDDAGRENEGDVILPAASATTEWMAWTIRHTSGYVCVAMPDGRADQLHLPRMVEQNEDPRGTAYCVAVDAVAGVTTGISAADRATTVRVLADPDTRFDDLSRPGHVVPLRARAGGVLERPGHTEAAVDLCRYAGLPPVAAICELVSDDGSMMRAPEIADLAAVHGLSVLTVADLIVYRHSHPMPESADSPRVSRAAVTSIPNAYGSFRAYGYADHVTGAEHIALVSGSPGRGALVRVHSECLTGEAFGSRRCDCGPQLSASMERIARDGGVIVYLRGHEGRGIGLVKKLAAYACKMPGWTRSPRTRLSVRLPTAVSMALLQPY